MSFLKKNIFVILFLFSAFIFSQKTVLACDESICRTSNQCASAIINCSDCCFCPGYGPCPTPTNSPQTVKPEATEVPDNITGKVYNPALPNSLSTLTGTSFLRNLLRLGIKLIFVLGAVIFFFMLLSGGIRWITGGGDKGKLEGAQKQITHALLRLAILLSSFAIIQLIENMFGISLLNINLPTL